MDHMTSAEGEYRLYRELASWWPLISPPEEYTQEAEYIAAMLGGAADPVRDVLDLGSGGGHVAAHLKDQFALTLLDISEEMLAVSRQLNPGCTHVQGDMRTARLGRTFDAVLVHDAIDYVTTEAGLRAVIGTASVHCRAGGVAAFVPDYVKDTFSELTGSGGGGTDASGRRAAFRERTWDPDPADDWVQAEYEFTLRSPDGAVEVISETHRLGAFSQATWIRLLRDAGFEPTDWPPPGDDPPLPGDDPPLPGDDPPLPGRRPENLFLGRRNGGPARVGRPRNPISR
jgi:SAM-dependent methyltransferase